MKLQLNNSIDFDLPGFLNWANIKSIQDYLKLGDHITTFINIYLQSKGIRYDLIKQSSLDTIINCIELKLCGK